MPSIATRPGSPAYRRPPAPGNVRWRPAQSLAVWVAFLFVAACAELAPPGESPPAPSYGQTPNVGTIQVFFTRPIFPDDQKGHAASLNARLVEFIGTARRSVDIAIFQLDLPDVTRALLQAKSSGAAVRVVTDDESFSNAKENAAFKQLQSAGIKAVAGNTNGIMHNKFVVVDGRRVWSGSWNFTSHDTWRYDNHAVWIESPELARNYTAAFEKMWVDEKFGPTRRSGGTRSPLEIDGVRVENYFAPEDKVSQKVIARLSRATQQIDFMAFSFTHDGIGEVVRDRARAGVAVRGVFETTGSGTQFSEFGKMSEAKLAVYRDGNPYLMHHKVFIIDGQTVIMGSFNFSQNADQDNDENILIIDSNSIAAAFQKEFERVLAAAKNPPK